VRFDLGFLAGLIVKTINVHQAKTTLSALLRLVEEEGEHIRIARNGKPVAELGPLSGKASKGFTWKVNPKLKAECFEDPTTPLDPEDWPGL